MSLTPAMLRVDADPCWRGYQQVGMKRKGKRRVPNCVPVAKGDSPWAVGFDAEDGKKYTKVVTNPETGRKNKVRYGAKGYSIAPGTNKGDRYCARSFGDMKSHGKDCSGPDRNTPLCLSRTKWRCSGKTSRRDAGLTPARVLGLTRIDVSETNRGKPCGKSYIPKTYKCGKGGNAVSLSVNATKLKKIAAAAGLTVAGAVALGVIANKYRLKPSTNANRRSVQAGVSALTPAVVTGRKKLLRGSTETTPQLPERGTRPSNKQIRNIDQYVSGSAQLNKALREGRTSDIDMDQVSAIDAWMANSTPAQGRFWRGISSENSYEQLRTLRVGDTFTDAGYGSFTSDVFQTRAFAVARPKRGDQPFILKVNGSLHPLPYDHMANYQDRKAVKYRGKLEYRNETEGMMAHERELLSPRNSQFKIKKIIPDVSLDGRNYGVRYGLYTIIEVDLIPQQVTNSRRVARGSSVAPLGLRRQRKTRFQDDNPHLNSSIAGSYEWEDYEWED